jgi:hypothetical protein
MMNRRGFLGSVLAMAVAPAIVRAESLMPVRQLAPSGPAAILDYWLERGHDGSHILDAMRYGVGMLELVGRDPTTLTEKTLATIPVSGSFELGGRLDIDNGNGFVDKSGLLDAVFLNIPSIVRLPVETAGIGTLLQPGWEVVFPGGMFVDLDVEGSLRRRIRVPGHSSS